MKLPRKKTPLCTLPALHITPESVAKLVVGEGASPFNTIVGDVVCFNVSRSDDGIKEGLEVTILTLTSDDDSVRLGRDFTLVNVLPNGGT